VNYQYEQIAVYDMEVYFKDGLTDSEQKGFYDAVRGKVDRVGFFHQSSVEIDFDNKTKEILMLSSDDSIRNFIHFHRDGNDLGMPKANEVFITIGMAQMLGLETGDTISVRNADMQTMELKVSGIFENHVSNFMIVLPETIRSNWGAEPEYQMAHITVRDYQDPSQTAAMITGMDAVMNVVVSQETADTIGGMMDALDLVVVTILVCAGLLAVIVLYNLTNINITERIREIATIKVLGFNAKETSAYVFKENILLSVMGAVVGLFFGVWLLEFVISYIKIDMVWFAPRLNVPSYIFSLILTMVSALIVDFIFHFKLEKINMAEALKSVE
jgi:putative ABC transport system permease protein